MRNRKEGLDFRETVQKAIKMRARAAGGNF